MTVFSRILTFTGKYPIARGMISYAILWPTSCLIQQSIAGKRWHNYDWAQCARFSLYGGLFTAPTLYGWVRISSIIWPLSTFRSAVTKAVVEQMTYGPAALACFFFGMSILEHQDIELAENEVKAKFLPTYKFGVCFWPVFQTINFLFIHERNRVPFVSVGSLLWCCFLSYMYELDAKRADEVKVNRTVLRNEA